MSIYAPAQQWAIVLECTRMEDGDKSGEVNLISSQGVDRQSLYMLTECYYEGRDCVSHRLKSYTDSKLALGAYKLAYDRLDVNVHMLNLMAGKRPILPLVPPAHAFNLRL